MTTYTTPHFATGLPDRKLTSEPGNRVRSATPAPHRTAGVSNEAAVLADGPTPDWQPGTSRGVPQSAIGALGAALVGGVALAIVLLAPSNKASKPATPGAAAQVAAGNAAPSKAEAAIGSMDTQAPAAGPTATDAAATQQAAATEAAPAAARAVTPAAPPLADAPAARLSRHASAPVAPPKAAPRPVPDAPVATPDATPAPADVQAPAMHQTPDASTVTPLAPTQDTPAPTPPPAP